MRRLVSLWASVAVVTLLALVGCSAQQPPPASEVTALNQFFAATGGSAWINSMNWGIGDPCTNEWFGVSCTNITNVYSVTELSLSGNGLVGDLPDQTVWLRLPNLSKVALSLNSLTGTLDGVLALGSVLTRVDLHNNAIGGTLKPELVAHLSNVLSFYITSNSIGGPLPTELGEMTSCNLMALSYNAFTGPIPPQLGNITGLEVLALGDNKLTGTLPPELGKLTGLLQLGVELNADIVGCLPPEYASLSNLKGLFAYGTQLSCPIPSWLSALTGLTGLYLHDAAFTGSPFPALCSLTSLTSLTLGGNRLSGPLDECIGAAWPAMTTLQMAHNQFSGQLPASLGLMANMKVLDLSSNQFEASHGLPRTMSQMALLQSFKINNNPLGFSIDGIDGVINSGGIEPLSLLPSLAVLELSNCSLRGDMSSLSLNAPEHVYSNVFSSLVQLVLSHNPGLGGRPSGNVIASMTSIQSLDISGNTGLRGNLDDISSLASLIAVGASGISWSGALPPGLRIAPDLGYVLSPNDGSLSCPQFTGVERSQVWSVDPTYYSSTLCRCSEGFYGNTPNCVLIPSLVHFNADPADQSVVTTPSFLASYAMPAAARFSTPTTVFADVVYGTARAWSGMDITKQVNMTTTGLSDVRCIMIEVSVNRTFFTGFDNFISIYQGNPDLSGPLFFSMRATDQSPYSLVSVASSAASTSGSPPNTVVAVVFGPIATVKFYSRDVAGDHVTIVASATNECPPGYFKSRDEGVYCRQDGYLEVYDGMELTTSLDNLRAFLGFLACAVGLFVAKIMLEDTLVRARLASKPGESDIGGIEFTRKDHLWVLVASLFISLSIWCSLCLTISELTVQLNSVRVDGPLMLTLWMICFPAIYASMLVKIRGLSHSSEEERKKVTSLAYELKTSTGKPVESSHMRSGGSVLSSTGKDEDSNPAAEGADADMKEDPIQQSWASDFRVFVQSAWHVMLLTDRWTVACVLLRMGAYCLMTGIGLAAVRVKANVEWQIKPDYLIPSIVCVILLEWIATQFTFFLTSGEWTSSLVAAAASFLSHQLALSSGFLSFHYSSADQLKGDAAHSLPIDTLVLIAVIVVLAASMLLLALLYYRNHLSMKGVARQLRETTKELERSQRRVRDHQRALNHQTERHMQSLKLLSLLRLPYPSAAADLPLLASVLISPASADSKVVKQLDDDAFDSMFSRATEALQASTSLEGQTWALASDVTPMSPSADSVKHLAPPPLPGSPSVASTTQVAPPPKRSSPQLRPTAGGASTQPQLPQVLAHPVCFHLFREHVAQSLSVESVHFYACVDAYTALPSRTLRATVAPMIGHLFLDADAEHTVNLPSTMVSNLRKQIDSVQMFPPSLFDEAQAEVLMLLTQNHWRPFQETPAFKFCKLLLRPDVLSFSG